MKTVCLDFNFHGCYVFCRKETYVGDWVIKGSQKQLSKKEILSPYLSQINAPSFHFINSLKVFIDIHLILSDYITC